MDKQEPLRFAATDTPLNAIAGSNYLADVNLTRACQSYAGAVEFTADVVIDTQQARRIVGEYRL